MELALVRLGCLQNRVCGRNLTSRCPGGGAVMEAPYGNEWGDERWQVRKEEDQERDTFPRIPIYSLVRGWIYFCLATKCSDITEFHIPLCSRNNDMG